MFEHLDTVNWHDLEHANGSATDVPKQLVSLYADDPWERHDAYDWLMSTIWCGGEIYSATPEIIPFLVQMVDDNVAPCRGRVLTALFWIAKSASEKDHPFSEPTMAALNASVTTLVDSYQTGALDTSSQYMLLLVLSYCREQAAYILSEIDTGDGNGELIRDTLCKGTQFERDLLFSMAAGCEDDPELDSADITTFRVADGSGPNTNCEARPLDWSDEETEIVPSEVMESWMRRGIAAAS